MSAVDDSRAPRVGLDVIGALALFAIAGVLLSQTGDGVRDWVMPRSVLYLLIAVGVVLLVKGIVRPGDKVSVVPPPFRGKGLDVAAFIVFSVVYVVIMPTLGFWITSVVTIFVMALLLAETRDRRTVLESIATSIGVCVVFYVLMLHVFYVPLPESTFLPL